MIPRLDPHAQACGEDLEDLSRVGAQQPWRALGPQVGRTALELWREAGRTGTAILAPPEASTQVAALAELRAAQLVEPDGSLTSYGRDLHTLLDEPAQAVRVEATDGRGAYTFLAGGDGTRWLVRATESPTSGRSDERPSGRRVAQIATHLTLDVVHPSWLPVLLASWLGLAPAWSFGSAWTLPARLVEARLDDPATEPPTDADPHLRAAWAQPWYAWTLRSAGPSAGALAVVHAGARGALRYTVDGDRAVLEPMPSAVVWSALLQLTAPPPPP